MEFSPYYCDFHNPHYPMMRNPFSDNYKSIQQELSSWEEKFARFAEENKEFQSRIEKTQNDFKRELWKEFNEVRKDIEKLDRNINDLNKHVEKLENNTENMKKDVEKMKDF